MKAGFKWNALLATLLTISLLAGSKSVVAQPLVTIHSFSPVSVYFVPPPVSDDVYTNSDGATPACTLLLSGDILYGTTGLGWAWGNGSFGGGGGAGGSGTIFKIRTDGSGFTIVNNFSVCDPFDPWNPDGAFPHAGLIISGDILYGTAFAGGTGENGTVFRVGTNGNFQTLHSFSQFQVPFPPRETNSDGANPIAELVVSGGVIYGSTSAGGPEMAGTLFKINTDGSGFNSLTNLGGGGATLALSNDVLYGTTAGGGSSNNGTVFKINGDWTGLTTLYSFTGGTNGAVPSAGLLLSGNVLYGTTTSGGSAHGTVFKLNLDGTGFTSLHSFTSDEGTPNRGTLVLIGRNLFGMTFGTVYSLSTNGTEFTVLHSFTGGSDGGQPLGGLTASGDTLYGTTSLGGTSNNGTVFSFSLLPHLAILASGQNVVLSWPTNYAGFDYSGYTLQSTTNLASPVWTTNFPAPVVINGQNTVTNPISGTQQFFRLSQ